MNPLPWIISAFALIQSVSMGAEIRCEAEDGIFFGETIVDAKLPGFSGWGYVTGFHSYRDFVDIQVNADRDGFYTLVIGYLAPEPKLNSVSVNGSMQGDRLFPATQGFSELAFGRVRLQAGSNKVRIGTHWGQINVDYIRLVTAPELVPFRWAEVPVVPNASPEAKELLTKLHGLFGKKIVAGQQDERGGRLDYIAKVTDGKFPILRGFDLLNYSRAYNRPDGQIEKARDWVQERQGMVTLSWHWFSPFGATEEVWYSYLASKTTFDASRVLDDKSVEYAAIIRDLDRVAESLKVLRDAHVPVLWRPLHEAEGRWFWWGARGPEVSRALYRLMFDRFTRVHGLNNLIWVWTTTDNPDALSWYPGDDVVDIIGADIYAPNDTRGSFLSTFDNLRQLYGGRKPIALCETGTLLDPDELVRDGADWLWFLVWDDFISRPEVNPKDLISRVYRDSRTETLDERGQKAQSSTMSASMPDGREKLPH